MKLLEWMQTNGEFGNRLYKQYTGISESGETIDINSLTHGTRIKLLWKCDVCNHEWFARLDTRIYNKTSCPKCKCAERNVVGKKHNKVTLLEWCHNNGEYGAQLLKEWIGSDEYGFELDIDSISYSSNRYAEFKCSKGHTWTAQIMNRTHNHTGCPVCNKFNFDKSLYDWAIDNNDIGDIILKQFAINNIDPKTISYKSGVNYNFFCDKCGTTWSTKLLHRTVYKTGCPVCNKASTSFGEQLIYRYYNKIFNNVCNRFKTKNGYEFDIVIFDINVCIEYNGETWHSDDRTIKRDKEKQEICSRNNIKLITVWQTSKEIIEDNSICIKNPRNYNEAIEMINSINKKLGINTSVDNDKLNQAFEETYKFMNS